MLKTDVGGAIFPFGLATASLSISPLNDRALVVKRINITNVSASDNWTVSVGQRVLMTFRILTTGTQQLLAISDGSAFSHMDWWEYCRDVLNQPADIPLPNGLTMVIASAGGATADISVEALEVDIASANVVGINHYAGTEFLIPVYHYLNASVSAIGAVQCDTQIAPAWVPPIFGNAALPVNWTVKLLCLWLEGAGVNTFSGAANHQSTTQDLRVFRNQVQMFTRQGNGIPNIGKASAAGSANTVLGQRSGIYPPFMLSLPDDDSILDAPITLTGGDSFQLLQEIIGDVTGGASYANAMIVWAARVSVPN